MIKLLTVWNDTFDKIGVTDRFTHVSYDWVQSFILLKITVFFEIVFRIV